MRWKECHVMDERVRFVARLLDGEKMASFQQLRLDIADSAQATDTMWKGSIKTWRAGRPKLSCLPSNGTCSFYSWTRGGCESLPRPALLTP